MEINFYTDIIDNFIEWVYSSIEETQNGQLWKDLVAYVMLVLAKENTGIERTLGGVYFAQGRFKVSDIENTAQVCCSSIMIIYDSEYMCTVIDFG